VYAKHVTAETNKQKYFCTVAIFDQGLAGGVNNKLFQSQHQYFLLRCYCHTDGHTLSVWKKKKKNNKNKQTCFTADNILRSIPVQQ
jgi:hypothetical protein